MLDVRCGAFYEHLALPHIAAQDDDLIGRAEGPLQQAVAFQLLQPLAI